MHASALGGVVGGGNERYSPLCCESNLVSFGANVRAEVTAGFGELRGLA